jgi:deoxyribonuclease-1-like protein
MRKVLYFLLLAGVAGGGWWFATHYEIQGLGRVGIRVRGTASGLEEVELPPLPERHSSIRIATFHLGPFNERKLANPFVVGGLSQIVREFDVIAVQDVQAPNQGLLAAFLDQVNSTGRHYDFVTAPHVGRDPTEQYSAFLFDRVTIQVDRPSVAQVVDPRHLFRRPPLVASFRVRGPDPNEAFTFTLINVHTDGAKTAAELDALAGLYRAVRDDGRGEDDILLLGDLSADAGHLGLLGEVPHLVSATSAGTTMAGGGLPDHILFDRRATVEFTGRAGVIDLAREFNVSPREAAEVSDHWPVWGEFSVFEGGRAGVVAARP